MEGASQIKNRSGLNEREDKKIEGSLSRGWVGGSSINKGKEVPRSCFLGVA